jgi:DNA-binding NtrC family response regulator
LRFSEDAERTLVEHGWRGNVRELENAVERAAVLTRADVIEAEDLLLEHSPLPHVAATDGSLQESLDRATAVRIRAALEEAAGNRTEAARLLGIDRTTLYRLMRRIGM